MQPRDQASRRRFATELERNFSVTAAAGSGKTRAITDRIVAMARSQHGREWLPSLVVVTFTNRAADEMQQRARQQILEAGVGLEVLAAFNRVYFGTIHSFAVKLLASHGHHLGLPAELELLTDDDELWNEFAQRQHVIGRCLSDADRRVLLRHVQARQLMELGRRSSLEDVAIAGGQPCPGVGFDSVYSYIARGSAMRTIPQLQDELRSWERSWRDGEDFLRWPPCTTKTVAFQELWRQAFAPLRQWVTNCSLCVAAEVQRDYRDFRVERGALTYGDQIALALELMRHPEPASRIRAKHYRVILDEAQDTDPHQFSLLLELTRPVAASGDWLATGTEHPGPGHFSMVGDFQQSIYRDRADLSQYRRVHQSLIDTGAAEELEFSVTFRLDDAAVDFVNETFREILNNAEGQVAFVELSPRPEVLPGQVVRLDLNASDLRGGASGKVADRHRAACEARQVAAWLSDTGLERLRARTWSDVAILCPRKAWLRPLRAALRAGGLRVHIQSESEVKGDSPAYAWFTALLTTIAHPLTSYEVVGVLREVFGLSDHDLAAFSQGHGERFQIARTTTLKHSVSDALNQLVQTRDAVEGMPLFTAACHVVDKLALRERLRALPGEDYEGLEDELDELLAAAALAEASGALLCDFAADLAADFEAARETKPAATDAIQLITCHKAKGSEWQAVIVPFLSRRIYPWNERYPRLIRSRGEVVVALDRDDIDEAAQAALRRAQRQEMERLLYVALTRAKHTLVLAFDNDLFAAANGQVHESSLLRSLRGHEQGELNHERFGTLRSLTTRCEKTGSCDGAGFGSATAEEAAEMLPVSDQTNLEQARSRSSEFPHKLIPSAYVAEIDDAMPPAEERETDFEFRPRVFDNPATRYGSWWHHLMEQIDWSADPQSWDASMERSLGNSPDASRSRKEWTLFRRWIEGTHPVGKRIRHAGAQRHAEMPFLWSIRSGAVLEGVIDLAVIGGKRPEACLILDWKTNQVNAGEIEHLRQHYKPQLAAYAKALAETTGMSVEGGLYLTFTGTWLSYEPDELELEWRRLDASGDGAALGNVAAEFSDTATAPAASATIQTLLWPE